MYLEWYKPSKDEVNVQYEKWDNYRKKSQMEWYIWENRKVMCSTK